MFIALTFWQNLDWSRQSFAGNEYVTMLMFCKMPSNCCKRDDLEILFAITLGPKRLSFSTRLSSVLLTTTQGERQGWVGGVVFLPSRTFRTGRSFAGLHDCRSGAVPAGVPCWFFRPVPDALQYPILDSLHFATSSALGKIYTIVALQVTLVTFYSVIVGIFRQLGRPNMASKSFFGATSSKCRQYVGRPIKV